MDEWPYERGKTVPSGYFAILDHFILITQASLEAELKAKCDVLRQKKKLEADVSELEVGLDHTNRLASDLQKSVKKYQQTVLESQAQVEDEQKQKQELREAAASAERHANSLVAEIEEHRFVEYKLWKIFKLERQKLCRRNSS